MFVSLNEKILVLLKNLLQGDMVWNEYSKYTHKYVCMPPHVAFDERMIDFKGRFGNKRKIKTKKTFRRH